MIKSNYFIILLLTAVTIISTVYMQSKHKSTLNMTLQTMQNGSAGQFELLNRIDQLPKSLSPHNNLVFIFKNFKKWKQDEANLPALIFQRSAYNIYPCRIYADQGNFTLFDKKKTNFYPKGFSLKKHNISHSVTFTYNKNGSVSTSVKEYQKLPPRKIKQPTKFSRVIAPLLSWICAILIGLSITLYLKTKISTPIEFYSCSLLLGVGAMALLIYYLSLCGIDSYSLYIIPAALISAGVIYLKRSSLPSVSIRDFKFSLKKSNIIITIAIALCTGALLLIISNASFLPQYAWDGFMIWILKTKVLFYNSITTTDFFTDRSFGFSHLKYPLLVPFIYLSGTMFNSSFNLYAARSMEILFTIGGIFFFYYAFYRKSASKEFSALLTMTMFSSAALIENCGTGMADSFFTIFYGASIFYQFQYLKKRDRLSLYTATAFTAFCAMTKNEGLALAAISIVLFTFFNIAYDNKNRKKRIKDSIIYAVTTFALILPWLIYSRNFPANDENYPARLYNLIMNDHSRIWEIPNIITHFATTLFSIKFIPVAAILVYTIILILKKRAFAQKAIVITSTYLITHLLLYILIFTITPWSLSFLYSTALDRLLFHLIPAIFFMAAAAYRSPQKQKLKKTEFENNIDISHLDAKKKQRTKKD